jgi:hypothetical protein
VIVVVVVVVVVVIFKLVPVPGGVVGISNPAAFIVRSQLVGVGPVRTAVIIVVRRVAVSRGTTTTAPMLLLLLLLLLPIAHLRRADMAILHRLLLLGVLHTVIGRSLLGGTATCRHIPCRFGSIGILVLPCTATA